MQLVFKILTLIFFSAIIFTSCEEIQRYPDTPEVKYKTHSFFSTTDALGNPIILVKLEIEVTDGDGDLGYPTNQTGQYSDSVDYDLHMTLYEKKNGAFIPPLDQDTVLKYRIPYIEREGQNKLIKGRIEVDLEFKKIKFDTIAYAFYIYDREMHKSNVDTTEDIVFTGIELSN